MHEHPISWGYILKEWLLYIVVWVGKEENLVNGSLKQKPMFDANPMDNGHDV
jgi:hypothetical protein